MVLTPAAQAIQAALLADAEALAAAESLPGDDVAEVLIRLAERAEGLDDWRFRALAGAVARRLAALEEAVYETHERRIARLAENLGGLLEAEP